MSTNLAYPGREVNGDTLTTTNFDLLPGGWLGYVENTTTQSGISSATLVTNLTVAVTVNPSRRIKLTAGVVYVQNTTIGRVKIYFVNAGNTLRTFVNNSLQAGSEAAQDGSVIITPTAGSHTYEVWAATNASTVDILNAGDTGPCYLLVEDIGPA